MPKIGDPGFLPKLVELLQVRDPLGLPLDIDPTKVGLTIAIPAELLLSRARPTPVQIVPPSGDEAMYITRLRQTSGAVVGQFSWAALAIAPHSTAKRIRRLDVVSIRVTWDQAGGPDGFLIVKYDGHLGAAPAAPTTELKRLSKDGVGQVAPTSQEVSRTAQVAANAASWRTADGGFAQTERVIERDIISAEGATAAFVPALPALSREVDFNQPHLCGFIIALQRQIVNTALTVDWEVIVRERY